MRSQSFEMTPARHYNDLQDRGEYILKSSLDVEKITAEIRYFENLEEKLKPFHPSYLGTSKDGAWENGYKIKKVPEADCGQRFTGMINGKGLDIPQLLNHLSRYFDQVKVKQVDEKSWQEMLERQLLERANKRLASLRTQPFYEEVEKVFKRSGWVSLEAFVEALNRATRLAAAKLEVSEKNQAWRSHGDLCLSNLIMHESKLYLIDPRGLFPREDGFLIPYYDMAKISQCLLGGYDYINNEVDYSPPFDLPGQELFKEFCSSKGLSFTFTRYIEAGHFFSMLPLHIAKPKKVMAFAQRSVDLFKALES